MSVRTIATAILPEMFGDVVGFASPTNDQVLMIKNGNGTFTVHVDEIREFFYA